MASRRVQRLQRHLRENAQERQEVAKKALGYLRVSTEKQAATGHGLEAQDQAVRAFAESQVYELVGDYHRCRRVRFHEARVYSGQGSAPGAQLAQERACSILWCGSLIASPATSPTPSPGQSLRNRLGWCCARSQNLSARPPLLGEMVFAVLAGMAAQDRKSITERTLAGKREKAVRRSLADLRPLATSATRKAAWL